MGSKDNGLSNTPILVVAKVIKDITGSAAEAGVAAIHINEKGAAATRRLHQGRGCVGQHPQPATRGQDW